MTVTPGTTYRLTAGTTVVCKDDEGYHRHTVEAFEEIDIEITSVGCSHSTMNGGGSDHYGRCPWTGMKMSVRTTFSRPASATFVPVAS
jgi:hypothetical protein